jgi:hypothetical protein
MAHLVCTSQVDSLDAVADSAVPLAARNLFHADVPAKIRGLDMRTSTWVHINANNPDNSKD